MVFLRLQPPFQWVLSFFPPGVKLPGREFNHSPHPVPRLGMSGATPVLPLYVFMEWTRKTLLFYLFTLLILTRNHGNFPGRVKTVLDDGGHFHPRAVFGRLTNILPVH
jgi:hypothetical protein